MDSKKKIRQVEKDNESQKKTKEEKPKKTQTKEDAEDNKKRKKPDSSKARIEDEDLPRGQVKKSSNKRDADSDDDEDDKKKVKRVHAEDDNLFGTTTSEKSNNKNKSKTASDDSATTNNKKSVKTPTKKSKNDEKNKNNNKKKSNEADNMDIDGKDDSADDDGDDGKTKEINQFIALQTKPPSKLEPFTFSSLSVGMVLLGAVREINEMDLVISLPNNLKGFVNLTEISDILTEQLEQKAQRDEEDETLPELSLYFHLGQVVKCIVTQLDKGSSSGGNRVELSLRASLLNEGLTFDTLNQGLLITGSVKSVEDHGYVVSFGLSDNSTGFLMKKNTKGQPLTVGQPIESCILSLNTANRTASLSLKEDVIAKSLTKEENVMTLETLKPGMLVQAKVLKVLPNGLFVTFLGYFVGSIDRFHLDQLITDKNIIESKKYKTGQKVQARILFIDYSTKSIGLSIKPHIVTMKGCELPSFKVGETYENAVVTGAQAGLGVFLEIPIPKQGDNNEEDSDKESSSSDNDDEEEKSEKRQPAFVHITQVSDKKVDHLEKKFKLEQQVKCRVLGANYLEGVLVVSMKQSVLDQPFLTVDDVEVGSKVDGTILMVSPQAIQIGLSDTIKARCPSLHFADITISKPNLKFKVGKKVTCRVWSIDPVHRRIVVSHKPTIVNSELEIIKSYHDAVPDVITHGVITKVDTFGCIVQFYNQVHGLVPASDLKDERDGNFMNLYSVGQPVKCRVVKADPEKERLLLSFKLNTKQQSEKQAMDSKLRGVDIGSVVRGTVTAVAEGDNGGLYVTTDAGVPGFIHWTHLSDHRGLCERLWRKVYPPNSKVGPMLVLEQDSKKNQLVLTLKPSLIEAAEKQLLPRTFSEIKAGVNLMGYVKNVTHFGVFVAFLGNVSGLAHKGELADSFVEDPKEFFSVGQTVRAHVLEIDETSSRMGLTLKSSVCGMATAASLQNYFQELEQLAKAAAAQKQSAGGSPIQWQNYVPGMSVKATVQMVKEFGVIFQMEDANLAGFAISEHVKGQTCKVGQTVTATVLDVDKEKSIVDLTLNPEISGQSSKKLEESSRKLAAGKAAQGTVLLVKENYLVLALPEYQNRIVYAPSRDWNATEDPFQRFSKGTSVSVTIQKTSSNPLDRVVVEVTSGGGGRTAGNSNKNTNNNKAAQWKEGTGLSYANDLKIGMNVTGKIVNIRGQFCYVSLGPHLTARLHITEVNDDSDVSEEHPFTKLVPGTTIQARVLNIATYSGDHSKYLPITHTQETQVERRIIDLTVKPSILKLSEPQLGKRNTLKTLKKGQIVTAVVHVVTIDALWVHLSQDIRGRVFVLDVSSKLEDVQFVQEKFKPGQRVRCRILSLDESRNQLDLSIKAVNEDPVITPDKFAKGMLLVGRITKVDPAQGLTVQLASHSYGRVALTDMDDVYRRNPTGNYEELQFLECFVLHTDKSARHTDLSIRPSRIAAAKGLTPAAPEPVTGKTKEFYQAEIHTAEELKPGDVVSGYVNRIVDRVGLFIQLSRDINALVRFADISDSFIKDFSESFPSGKLVRGRVIKIDPLAKKVEMSLKSSVVAENRLTFADIQVEKVYKGTVKRITEFGVFVTLKNTQISGLCHITKALPMKKEGQAPTLAQVQAKYSVGDSVKVLVSKKNDDKKQLSLSLVDPRIAEYQDSEDETEANGENADEEEVQELISSQKKKEKSKKSTPAAEEEEEDAMEVDEQEEAKEKPKKSKKDEKAEKKKAAQEENKKAKKAAEEAKKSSEKKQSTAASNENSSKSASTKPTKAAKTEGDLGVSAGFEWDDFGANADRMDVDDENSSKSANNDNDEDEELAEEDMEDEELASEKRKSKKERKAEKLRRETEVMEKEARLLEQQGPQTAADYEKLLLSSPNNSFIWVKYMAFHISLTEIDKARKVAEKALKTINFREEKEKINIWVAWMNLENMYGTPESLQKVFAEANTYNEPKVMHTKLVEIYENSGNVDKAEELYKVMIKKFKESAKVWRKYAEFLLQNDKVTEFRNLIPQSFKVLPKRKHIPIASNYAQLEFKYGSAERGRTIFEGIVSNYPKRADIWNVYIDMEMKNDDEDVIRRLFERVTSLNLSTKRMKTFFKRYLAFEKEHGTDDAVERVKQKAISYVEGKTK